MPSSADLTELVAGARQGAAGGLQAANDDAASATGHELVGPGAAWDPFEVWARRVRDPRQPKLTAGELALSEG